LIDKNASTSNCFNKFENRIPTSPKR